MSLLSDNIFGFPTVPMQRSYLWDFILPSFGFIVDGIAVSKFCQSCRFGQYNIGDVETLQVGPFQKFFPGTLAIETVVATFLTPIPDIVSLYFINWKNKIVDNNGFYSPSNAYKKNIYAILYDKSGLPVNFIQMNKAFPIKFPTFDLNYSDEKMVQFDIEFRVDNIKIGKSALGNMGSIGSKISGAIDGVLNAVGF